MRLSEIRKAIQQDLSLRNLTEDQEQEYIDELMEKRKLQLTGVRASHSAASLDIRHCIESIFNSVHLCQSYSLAYA